MRQNVGGWDKTLRLVAGAALLGFGLFGPFRKARRIWAVAAGALPLISGLSGYCPLNKALGVDTYDQTEKIARTMAKLA